MLPYDGAMTHVPYPASPGVGDVISQSFKLLRQRPGLYFGLGAVSAGATLLGSLAMLAVAATGWSSFLMAAARLSVARVAELAGMWAVVVGAISLLIGLVALLVSAMLIRLTAESLAGLRPSLADLFGVLGGFARRILPLAVLGVVAYVVVFGLALLPMWLGMSSLAQASPDIEAIGAGLAISLLLLLPASLAAIFVGVRLLYVTQVVAQEELAWIAALRRAWGLTSGAFWRTFGALLVVHLVVYAATMAVNMVTQIATLGAFSDLETMNPLSPEFFGQLMMAMVVPMTAQTLLQVVTAPFLTAAVTVMYLNRRRELTPAAPYGPPAGWAYPPQQPPGYPSAPPSGYGYPQPGYPQPGYPQPGYPQPGYPPQTYPPPGYPPASHPPQGYPPYPPPGQPPQGYRPS